MAIPDFDHNLVLPPHLGNPTNPSELSPYPCSTVELVEKFNTSAERNEILKGFINFRTQLRSKGLSADAFQWIDGSFLEDIEHQEGRAPRDIDVVTIYWGYDTAFQTNLVTNFPEFASPKQAKANFSVDHYALDASFHPQHTVEMSRYWGLLFSHNRLGVWKGMLRIDMDTVTDDIDALTELNS
jgi:hypothetical protein